MFKSLNQYIYYFKYNTDFVRLKFSQIIGNTEENCEIL